MSARLRKSSAVLMILGVLLIALAAVTRFVVTPALTKLPGDTDTTAHYDGTATMLNSAALAAHDTAHAIAKDVPITMDRHIYVTDTDGDTATVHDEVTMHVPGAEAEPDGHVYTIDRVSMNASEVSAEGVDPAAIDGLDFTLPLNPGQQDYSIYDTATQTTVPLTYAGESTVSDRDTYHYDLTASGPLRNEHTLQTLPPALPKALIAQIMPMLPEGTQQALTASMDTLPDAVALTYTVTTTGGMDADQTLGAPLNAQLAQTVVANVDTAAGTVPLLPVIDVKAHLSDETVADNVATVADKAKSLNLISTEIPAALALLGGLLVVVGFVRRRPKTAAVAPGSAAESRFSTVD